MQFSVYEIERLTRPSRDQRLDQQYAELSLLRGDRPTRGDRIRIRLSNRLVSIAESIRPSGASHGDIASA